MGGFPGYNQSNQTWTKIRSEPHFLLEPELLLHPDHYFEFSFKPNPDLKRKIPHSRLSFPLQNTTSRRSWYPQGDLLWWGATATARAWGTVPCCSLSPRPTRSGQSRASLVLPAALPDRQVCSARGPLSPSSPPPIPATNTPWWRHTLVCVFPMSTGKDIREEQADLSLAPAPLLCPCDGAALLPCSCTGLPSSSLTPHTMTRGLGPAPWKSEVPSRGVADVWEKAALGKRPAKAPFTSSPAADSLLGSLWFPIPVTQEEGPRCRVHRQSRAERFSLGKRPRLRSPPAHSNNWHELKLKSKWGKGQALKLPVTRFPCQGDKSLHENFYTGSRIQTSFSPKKNFIPKVRRRGQPAGLLPLPLLYARSSGWKCKCSPEWRGAGAWAPKPSPWENRAGNQHRAALRKCSPTFLSVLGTSEKHRSEGSLAWFQHDRFLSKGYINERCQTLRTCSNAEQTGSNLERRAAGGAPACLRTGPGENRRKTTSPRSLLRTSGHVSE